MISTKEEMPTLWMNLNNHGKSNATWRRGLLPSLTKFQRLANSFCSFGSSIFNFSPLIILHSEATTETLKNWATSRGVSSQWLSMCSMSSSISSSIISSIIVLPYPKSLKMCKDVLLTSLQVWPFDRKTPGISPRLSPPRTYSIKGKDRNLFQIYLAQISHTI